MNNEPIIIWTGQFDPQNQPDHHFQCDCACPDNVFALHAPPVVKPDVLRHPYLHVQALPHQRMLMFNPLRDSGVAVLNAEAVRVWERFRQPRRAQDVTGAANELTAVVERLFDAGLLEPANAEARISLMQRSPPQTLSAWVHVTNECNLRCDYCYIRKSGDDMSEEVGRAAVDAVVRSALKHGFPKVKLKFAGGEATMNLKRVFDIQAYAMTQAAQEKLQLDTCVLSNGVSIGERAIAEFEQRGIRVSISLDGVGEAHDAQRKFASGAGSFRWVDRTLNRLIARGIKPFISITLSGRNAEGLPDVIRYVVERDLPFNINFFRENECATSFVDLRLQDDKIIAAMRRAFDVLEANLPDRCLLGSLVDRAQFDQPHDKTCSVGDSYLVIDHNGNVAKCQMEIERPITNVYVDDPLSFIRTDKIGVQNLSVEEKEGCRECEWRYWCTGGCPALTFRATGRYDVKSPNCRIYKALYPLVLRLEATRLMRLAGMEA